VTGPTAGDLGSASRPPAPDPTPYRFSRTTHLVELVAESERLASALAGAEGADRDALVARTVDASVLATLRLDGARLERLPATEDLPDQLEQPEVVAATARPGTWLDAMGRLRSDPDEAVQALETLGARTALGATDLEEGVFTHPTDVLAELHRRLTRGLVGPEHAGTLRRSDQAVHDASIGRILYFPTQPAAIARELALLEAWLVTTAPREHGLVVSGMLHLELLRIHPFEAANGRLARAAARLVLRARGLDPGGLAAPEPDLEADPLGYHEEVASTLRRRDATIWLERWGEAVTDALRRASRTLELYRPDPPSRAAGFVAARDEDAFTVADYRADAGVGPEDARADLRALLDAGAIRRVPGSRGLRFVRRGRPA
jgi:Fic family protein